MLALLRVGALVWLKLDPSRDIFDERTATVPSAAIVESPV
jgi:hypothetical protein